MERFKKAIFKQREEINDKMAEMFGLLKELTLSRTPEKVLVREEADSPVTKCVNAISLIKMEKEKSFEGNKVEEMKDEMDDESARSTKEELTGWETKAEVVIDTPRSRHIGYYLKHEINEKLIEGLVDNQKYNDSLFATRLGKMDYETYNSLSAGPMYNAILKKKLAKKRGHMRQFCDTI
ncbi:hypothetical protein Tco_0014100 [Tanacetum coccineum]